MASADPRQYLVSFDSTSLPQRFADVLVIGSGVAGLRAAVEIGPKADVIVVTKDELKDSNTERAQGGIAAVFASDDTVQAHIEDTVRVGCGLCDEGVVKHICEQAPDLIRELDDWGAAFDRDGEAFALAREGGHGHPRVVHARGDGTGAEVEKTLIRKVRACENVRLIEHTFVIDLLVEDGTCLGAVVWSQARGLTLIWANAVLLAAGGAGQVFRETTNPNIATGDGVAMAYRAGCRLRDLEFVQFHPTTLYVAGAARTLISEAARGEGGVLVNKFGERFMEKYSEMKELAPRDVVSRAILTEMQQTHDTNVYLDLTHVAPDRLATRFPQIKDLCSLFDINISEDLIPVCPSAHYMIGGVAVDRSGRSTIHRLYACGEAASTGLHGANRLGSNSLLEGLAMGKSTGETIREAVTGMPPPTPHKIRVAQRDSEHGAIDLDDLRSSLRSVMWRNVGIFRDAQGLERTLERIGFWSRYALACEFRSPRGWRVQNMLMLAGLITRCALDREESRGVHYRTDFPDTLPEARHSLVSR
jgi:L-aspartate oxidase